MSATHRNMIDWARQQANRIANNIPSANNGAPGVDDPETPNDLSNLG